MKITMAPYRAAATALSSTLLIVRGDVLIVEKAKFDFSKLELGGVAEHDTLESDDQSPVTRAERTKDGLHVFVRVGLGPEFDTKWAPASDPRWTVDVDNGPVAIPGNPKPEED